MSDTADTIPAQLPTNLAALTDTELTNLLNTHAHNDDAITAIITELDQRDQQPEQEDIDPAEAARALIDTERRNSETREQTVDRLYGDMTFQRYITAETDTNGYLLNKAGQAAQIDPYTLFHGPAKRAAKYASDELLDWWQQNGRITWIEYKAQMLGRPSDIKAAQQARHNSHSLTR